MKAVGRTLLGVLLVVVMVLSCGRNDTTDPSAKPERTRGAGGYEVDVLHLQGEDWGYPTPYAHYPRGPGGFKMCLIFDSLLERDEKGLIPWLAENYTISDDGLTYRFELRKEVRWQDGTPLNAEDVAFSINYANQHPTTWSYLFNTIETVTTDGDATVIVQLKKAHAAMLDNIGRARIIPKHIWEKIERPRELTTAEAVIGCGPYRLTGYSKEHGTYRFEAYEDYWGPKPRIRVIEHIPVSEIMMAYESREIDLTELPPDLAPRFQKNPEHKVVKSPAFWGYRLLLNMRDVPWLRHVQVRQAVGCAIDRPELVAKIARGAAVPGSPGMLPPDHVMAAKDIQPCPYDPERARRLLAQAGYDRMDADGLRLDDEDRPMVLELLCSSKENKEVRMAELIRQQLKRVGIGLTIRSLNAKARDSRVREQQYQMAILGHGGWGGDPDYLTARYAPELAGPSNAPSHNPLPGFTDSELTKLLDLQQRQINPDQRRRTIEAIQHRLAAQVPEIALFYTTQYTIYRPEKYDGWMFMYDHHSLGHGKLSYLERSGPATPRF